jgi:hypothetical protein
MGDGASSNSFFCLLYLQRLPIRLRIHHHPLHTRLEASREEANADLASVSD